jgi:hypothetical protein
LKRLSSVLSAGSECGLSNPLRTQTLLLHGNGVVVLFLPLIYLVMQLERRTATLVSWSSQMNRFSRILSAVDFSETARAAFDNALVLSRTHNAELTVVHAIPKDERFGQHARERIAMIAALRQAAEVAGVLVRISVQHSIGRIGSSAEPDPNCSGAGPLS